MREHWPSTKALSVHNALLICGRDMTGPELVTFLQRAFDSRIDSDYVHVGVAFLLERDFARLVGPVVVANRSCGELARADNDSELVPTKFPGQTTLEIKG